MLLMNINTSLNANNLTPQIIFTIDSPQGKPQNNAVQVSCFIDEYGTI